MARGAAPGEGLYRPEVAPEDLPRKLVPRVPDVSNAQGDAAIEGGLQALGEAQQRKYQADSATWAGDQLANLRLQACQALEQRKAQGGAGDPGNFAGDYLKQFDDLAKPVADQAARNPYASRMLNDGLRQLKVSLGDEAIRYEAQQRITYQNQSISDNLDKQLPLVRSNPELAQQIGATLSDQINSTNNGPGDKLRMLRAMDAQLTGSAALGLADRDPVGVYDQLRPGGKVTDDTLSRLSDPRERANVLEVAAKGLASSAARGVVQAYNAGGPAAGARAEEGIDKLPYDSALKDQIRAEAHRQLSLYRDTQRDKYGEQVVGLESRIANGTPEAGDRQLLMDLYHRNVFDPGQAGNKLGQLENAYDKQAGETGNAAAISQAYTDGKPLDPKDPHVRKGVDALFTTRTQTVEPGSPQWINQGADIASRTGVAPPSMVAWARTQLVSGDPEVAAQAAATIGRLQDASPRGSPYSIDDKTKAMAAVINEDIRAGRDPIAAVNGARAVAQQDPKQVANLDAQLRRLKPENFAASAIGAAFDKVPGAKVGGLFGFGGELPPLPSTHPMVTDYTQLLQHYYRETGGNLQAANALAQSDITRVWGVSGVNGAREFMRWAPENSVDPQHIIPIDKTTAAIRSDLEDSIAKEFPGIDAKSARLVSDASTDRSLGRRYTITVMDKYGFPEPLLRGDGSPVTYVVPDGQAVYEKERARLIEQSHAAAVRDREAFEQFQREHASNPSGFH